MKVSIGWNEGFVFRRTEKALEALGGKVLYLPGGGSDGVHLPDEFNLKKVEAVLYEAGLVLAKEDVVASYTTEGLTVRLAQVYAINF